MTQKRTLVLGCILLACSGESLYVGTDAPQKPFPLPVSSGGSGGGSSAGSGGTTSSSVGSPVWPTQAGCPTDPDLAGLVGTWDGALEDFFLKPVEHVRIVINGASAQGLCGTFTWGDKAPFPPAADPDALYPPSDYWTPFGYGGAPSQYLPPVEGFPYTITDSGERLPTLRLEVTQSEPWQSWCRLQTPVQMPTNASPAKGYTCDHFGQECDASPDISGAEQFMCGACEATGAVCVCDANSCDVVRSSPQSFDLTLSDDGQTLSGAFDPAYALPASSWEQVSGTSLRLTRVDP